MTPNHYFYIVSSQSNFIWKVWYGVEKMFSKATTFFGDLKNLNSYEEVMNLQNNIIHNLVVLRLWSIFSTLM